MYLMHTVFLILYQIFRYPVQYLRMGLLYNIATYCDVDSSNLTTLV